MFGESYIMQVPVGKDKESDQELWNKIYDKYPEFRDKILLFFRHFDSPIDLHKLDVNSVRYEQDIKPDVGGHQQSRTIVTTIDGTSSIMHQSDDDGESPDMLNGTISITLTEAKFVD